MDQTQKRPGFFNISIIFLLCAGLHYRVSYTPADGDLWGHLKFGQDLLEHRALPSSDAYSFLTQGQPWINHEWLAESLFAAAYLGLGTSGLVLLKTAIDSIIIGAMFITLLKNGLDPIRTGIVILVAAFLLFYHILTVRPQLFTYLLFLVTLLVLKRVENGGHRWLLALPPLLALWINLHGGVLAGWGAVVVWSSTHLALRHSSGGSTPDPARATILATLTASTAALLANPYGYVLPEMLLRTATVPRPDILEWQSVAESRYHFAAYLALLAASISCLFAVNRRRKPALVVVFLVTAIMPLVAIRHLPLFAIAAVILAGEFIAAAWNRWPSRLGETGNRLERGLVVISVAGGVLFLAFSLPNYVCMPIVTRLVGSFPARATAVLGKTSAAGNLVTHFNWGEYLIWHVGPRIRVSIDGRRETIYPDRVRDENSLFAHGEGDWAAILRRTETDLALVRKDTAPFNLLVLTPNWVIAYQDTLCAIFARKGSSWERQISAVAPPEIPCDGEGLCFP
jgi:hypothetical protein